MAVTDIAVYGCDERAVSLSEIAVRQDISVTFLEQLFAKLRRAGIVESLRGAAGGYRLTGPVDAIQISDIMHAVDEVVETKRCEKLAMKSCINKGAKCLSHDLWQAMEDHIEGFFSAISIRDVIERRFPVYDPELEPAK